MQQNRLVNKTLVKDENSLIIDVLGLSTVGIQLSGTFSATVQFEGSIDGTTYTALTLYTPAGVGVTSATTTNTWTGSCAGLRFVRVRISAYTSGSVVVNAAASLAGGGSGGSSGGGGGGAVTVADGADAALGATTDAAISSDTTGTVSGKLRGLVKILADVWDDANNRLNASIGTRNETILAQSAGSFTITLASLANAAGRQSTMITNSSGYPYVNINLKITSGGVAPTAGSVYEVYLLTSDGTVASDGAGASDAAITIENAQLVGTIVVTATTAKAFYGAFNGIDIRGVTSWGIAIKNSSGQALSSTEGDHVKQYTYYNCRTA